MTTTSYRTRTKQKQRVEEFIPVVTAVSVDTENQVVHFSREIRRGHYNDYVPFDSIRQKKVSKEKIEKINSLLDENLEKVFVAKDVSPVETEVEKYTGDKTFHLTGEYEMWKCHKIGPHGEGSRLSEQWREIEDEINS